MFFSNLFHWFTTAAHWHGTGGIPNRLWEHFQLCVIAVGAAAIVAVPLGLVFGHLRRGAFAAATVVNVGRAGLLDHAALAKLLREGQLSGAILDVLPAEPLPASSELWSVPNLVVVPHVSSDDADGYMRETMALVCRNVSRLRAGRALVNVVDAKTGY